MNLVSSLLRPIQAFRAAYLPLVMVYFAYGALGLIDVTRDLWIKEKLTLTPSDLAGIGVWLTLPWTVKMVFGELVDCVPIFGSQRRVYILIGAPFTAAGLVILAGAAGGWLVFARPDHLYVLGALSIVLGTVIQDVVADAMSTEVVSRVDAAGKPVPEENVRAELGMVQVLGRLSLSAGILAVAGLVGMGRRPDVARERVPARTCDPRDLDHRRLPDQIRNRGAARRSTGASSAAALRSAPSWSCSRSAAFRSRRRSSS